MLVKFLIFCSLGLVLFTEKNLGFVIEAKSRLGDIKVLNNYDSSKSYSFVLIGASGDLAKREIYPALWELYHRQLLPNNIRIYGYARRNRTIEFIRDSVKPFVTLRPGEEQLYDKFWSINSYLSGNRSNQEQDFKNIGSMLDRIEGSAGGNRIFHLAIPPSTFYQTVFYIKNGAMAKRGWTRLVIEKPFGHDLNSSEELSAKLSTLFTEDQIYRNDHFLGYEMVQNLLTLRFANRMLEPSWNNKHVASVRIDFKENFNIEGRGVYFDENGIIRDVMQNHLLQIMSLIAMEEPKTTNTDDLRDAKVAVLSKTKEIEMNDVVVGQYIGNPESKDPRERIGYLEEPTVSDKNSTTATFALAVLRVDNERWRGVPFIIRAGKGLNINRTEVTVQYKNVDNEFFGKQTKRNEFVIKIGPTEALQAKITSKIFGIGNKTEDIKLDFDYRKEGKSENKISAYGRLLFQVFNGSQRDFVRSDELREAWRIFTPILHELESKKNRPIDYKFGSTGPHEADQMEKKNNFL